MAPPSRTTHRAIAAATTRVGICLGLGFGPAFTPLVQAAFYPWAETARSVLRGRSTWEGNANSLLVDYFRTLQEDKDVAAFGERVAARYPEETLDLILTKSKEVVARQAAVTALFVHGTYQRSNSALGRALADSDPLVRSLAQDALWAVWCRAGTPEQNQMLRQVSTLIDSGDLKQAESLVNTLITQAPDFVEASNQRAIIYFHQGRFDESARDCQRVIERNRYHIGAISGLAQCQRQLKQTQAHLETMRRAAAIQPYNDWLKEQVKVAEAEVGAPPSQRP
jgi:tetratricopeptide (TPR) repeat protein